MPRVQCFVCGGPHIPQERHTPEEIAEARLKRRAGASKVSVKAPRRVTQQAPVVVSPSPIVTQQAPVIQQEYRRSKGSSIYAPRGECRYCDARREKARLAMRRSRERRGDASEPG